MAESKSTRGGALPLPTTTVRITAIPLSTTARTEYQHQKLPSLRLRVGGTKSWIMLKRIDGRMVRHTIGRFPELSLTDAERQAQALVGQAAAGSFVPKKVAAARGMTLQQAFGDYLKFRSTGARPLKPRTIQSYTGDMARSFSDWMDRPVASITADDVKRRHAKRSEVAPARADGAMRVLRAVLRWAADQADQPIERIPTTKLRTQWNKPARRTAHLTAAQMPAYFKALADHGSTGRCLQLLLLTGCRSMEIRALRRDQVDLVAATITVTENKASRPVTLPLSGLAMQVVQAQLASLPRAGKWLFPQNRDARKPLADPRATHRIACKAAGADPMDVHALRRTFATAANRFGGMYTVKSLLNHAINQNDVTAGYVQTDMTEMRRVADAVAALCEAAA